MIRTGLRAIGALLVAAAGCSGQVSSATYVDDVRYLSSPELKGRATPSPELEKAAGYISGLFKSFGLKPLGDKGFEQSYTVHGAAKLGPANHLSFEEASGRKTSLKLASDYAPFRFSSKGRITAPVVFVGYGITTQGHYDDYSGIDVKDKVVLMLRHEPKEDKNNLSENATFALKAANAKAHGAKGVLLINDTFSHPDDRDNLAGFSEASGPSDAGVYFAQVKESYAEEWFKAEGLDPYCDCAGHQ